MYSLNMQYTVGDRDKTMLFHQNFEPIQVINRLSHEYQLLTHGNNNDWAFPFATNPITNHIIGNYPVTPSIAHNTSPITPTTPWDLCLYSPDSESAKYATETPLDLSMEVSNGHNTPPMTPVDLNIMPSYNINENNNNNNENNNNFNKGELKNLNEKSSSLIKANKIIASKTLNEIKNEDRDEVKIKNGCENKYGHSNENKNEEEKGIDDGENDEYEDEVEREYDTGNEDGYECEDRSEDENQGEKEICDISGIEYINENVHQSNSRYECKQGNDDIDLETDVQSLTAYSINSKVSNDNKRLEELRQIEIKLHSEFINNKSIEVPLKKTYCPAKARQVCRKMENYGQCSILDKQKEAQKRFINNQKSLQSRYKQKVAKLTDTLSVIYLRDRCAEYEYRIEQLMKIILNPDKPLSI